MFSFIFKGFRIPAGLPAAPNGIITLPKFGKGWERLRVRESIFAIFCKSDYRDIDFEPLARRYLYLFQEIDRQPV